MPGAVDALLELQREFHVIIFSSRLSPWDPWTGMPRHPEDVARETMQIRSRLDEVGLTGVDIWTLPGKPGAIVYIDDRAERYQGRPGSWKTMVTRVRARAAAEPPKFPRFPVPR